MKKIKRIISCLDLVKEWIKPSKKIRQTHMPNGRISQEKTKESLLRKSWDFESNFGCLSLSPSGRISPSHDPYFLALELRKR